MIPDTKTIHALWKKYNFSSQKQIHCELVKDVARVIAKKYMLQKQDVQINEQLLYAAALLHDIDKNIEKFPGESHPDAAVRILKREGMDDVAEVIRTHPLHTIIDAKQSPKTIEQKILFLSDKMVQYSVIGVEKRFALWEKEDMDEKSQDILKKSYPYVRALRDEILGHAGITEEDIEKFVQ